MLLIPADRLLLLLLPFYPSTELRASELRASWYCHRKLPLQLIPLTYNTAPANPVHRHCPYTM
ncbi:MAG: hypothetical protein ACKOKB_07490, partial [Bacteroidota bacterium]